MKCDLSQIDFGPIVWLYKEWAVLPGNTRERIPELFWELLWTQCGITDVIWREHKMQDMVLSLIGPEEIERLIARRNSAYMKEVSEKNKADRLAWADKAKRAEMVRELSESLGTWVV